MVACLLVLGVVQNCHHFHNRTHSMRGGGRNGGRTLFKNVDCDAVHFHTESLKSNFSKYSFGWAERGHNRQSSVYAFDNVDNSGRPLRWSSAAT